MTGQNRRVDARAVTGAVRQRAAIAVGCLGLATLTFNGVLVWVVESPASAGSPPAATLWLLGLAGAPLLGMLLAARQPRNVYGWLLLSFGVTSGLLEATELAALYAPERSVVSEGRRARP